MSTERNLAPEGFRTAAYLEARARMDFRRGKRGPVHCTPGNKKCGNRCIPNEWDCRMKGEGNDPHLKAVKFDPVSGLANLERGAKRFGKFLRTGSFSELESGKRSVIRGAVKLKPGNLQEKKDYQTWLENNFAKVAVPIALVGGAIAVHSILKTGNTFGYREGAGRRVEETVWNGIGRALDVIPGIGHQRAYTRQRAGEVLSSLRTRTRGAQVLQANLGGRGGEVGLEAMQIPRMGDAGVNNLRDGTAPKAIAKSLEEVDNKKLDFYTWNEKHREAFLGAKVDGRSVFAETTAQIALDERFNLGIGRTTNKAFYIERLSRVVTSERIALVQLAKQKGFKIYKTSNYEAVHKDDMVRFVEAVYPDLDYNDPVKVSYASRIMQAANTGDPKTKAYSIYRKEVEAWDNYFAEVAKNVKESPGASSAHQEIRAKGIDEIRRIADTRRTEYLISQSKAVPRAGLSHEQLFLRDYYHRNVVGTAKSTYAITPNLARSAASELSGRSIESPNEAIEVLRTEYGFPTVQLIRSQTNRAQAEPRPTNGTARPMRRRSPAQQLADLMRQKNPDGTPRYATREAAEAELARRKKQRGDVDDTGLSPRVRAYLETQARLDKRCGKSGIPDNRKCSKTTAPQPPESQTRARGASQPGVTCAPPNQKCGNMCIPPTATCHLKGGGGNALDNAAKVAAIAGGAAAVVGAVRNRKQLRTAARRGVLQARTQLRNTNREAYRNTAVRARVIRRSASNVARTQTDQIVSNLSKKTIKSLSSEQVDAGINSLPKQYQEQARRLVGEAKRSAAHLALYAKGGKMTSVNTKDNFSNWEMKDGTMLSTGSVGDSLLIYNTRPQESIGGARTYSTQFRIDGEFDAKSTSASRNARGVVTTTKKMFQHHMDSLPDNSIVWAIPYSEDNKGAKRKSIYEKYGFRQALSSDERLFAMKTKGQFTKMGDNHIEQIADYIRNDSIHFDFDDTRFDKRCGKSGIPDNRKCSKVTSAQSPEAVKTSTPVATNTVRNLAIGTTALGAVGALAAIGIHKGKVSAYRRNVSNSAIEAEKMAAELERSMREAAARRLKKKPSEVTDFEASVYNFKDKGHDRGFGSNDNEPAWYGQTPNSKGAVVMLSYADDNKFTKRGQGSHMMASNKAFQSIWGDRDILPYANNISQPTSSVPDDLVVQEREAFVKKVEGLASKVGLGEAGRGAAKSVHAVQDIAERFSYLRENVNRRGHNPDAIRAAAFVVAQRRLTGKPVDIMSYSNGGNVATETLAILKEMGYRDVKVVNVAGPTFGIFSHSDDNMRTWVSEGDEFFQMSRGGAFTGGNTRMLKNKNIPHGLTEKIDKNNRENGANWKKNYNAKNSYLLDEQLEREAWTYLNVDRKRSGELVDELVWRISENKQMEGDLAALFGDSSKTKMSEYAKSLKTTSGTAREKIKSDIRSEVEERMIETWYGGYSPKTVKNAQKQIKKDLMQQVSPQAAPAMKTKRPTSLGERASKLMEQNPGMSREAALKQAKREMLNNKTDRVDAYTYAYLATLARLTAA